MTPLERVLERLPGHRRTGAGWQARCPAHDDTNPSLAVSEGHDGKVLVNCYAGCASDAVVAAIGLAMRDLFPEPSPAATPRGGEPEQVYRYTDAAGTVVFEVVRLPGKQFRQRRPDGRGGWLWNMNATPRVLYRLPEVLRAVAAGNTVYVVEGEKDADAVVRIGACATTNPGGAGKFSHVAGVADALHGAHVIVVADRDEPGRKHAADVVRRLEGVAASVEVRQAVIGKDVADHLAAGYTLDQLEVLELDGDHDGGHALQGDDAPAWNLPASFWQARPVLTHIRQAAHHRARSADAVLGAVLARVAALTPPTVTLPAVVGSRASLNVLHAVVASSGGGKSTSVAVASEVVPWPLEDHIDTQPPGSGEGLVEAYHGLVTVDGKREKRQTRYRLMIYLDEGQALGEMGNRKGSTLMPTLRTAWSGELLGQANATTDTRRVLRPHTYRLAVVVAVQLEHAAPIVGDSAGGTPQRFAWFAATDPSVPDDPPPWPGPLDITPPPAGEIDLHPDIAAEIRLHALQVARGEITLDPLDSHRHLVRLKLSALLAILDGRRSIGPDDWHLAGVIAATSNAVRDRIIAAARQANAQREAQYTDRAVRTQQAVTNSAEQRALDGMARAIARRVHRSNGEPVTRRELHASTKPAWRQLAALDEAIAVAEGHGWIRHDGERWTPGTSRPS